METFVYDDAIVKKFMFATMLWAVVSMSAGVLIALQLVAPAIAELRIGDVQPFGFFSWFYEVEWLTFGRLRPLHTNAAIFAFAGNVIFMGVYYSLQRLCKARMWSDLISNIHFWGWQLIIVSAAVTLPLGITAGKEYAELEWPIDIGITVIWVLFGVNMIMTLVKRRERHMYVAIWFYLATWAVVAVLHVFNSLAVPVDGWKSYSLYAGVQDAQMQWWYGHNAVAFFLTTPFLGLMYYFLPKAAERPVFSYKLSIVHFWSLVFIYIWAGPHHLHYTALPQWASTIGMLFSLMLWMPSWGGMINGLMTLRGAWHKVSTDPVLKFFLIAVTFYGMSTFEGPMLSVKAVNALSHYTDWTIGHVHGGTLGWNAFMGFGIVYWLFPRLYGTKLWSNTVAEWHFWLGTIGIFLYWISMQWAGITQGLMWRAFDDSGALAYPDFVETVTKLFPMYYIRALGGGLFVVGLLMMVYNLLRTFGTRDREPKEVVHRAAALSKGYVEPVVYTSDLKNVIGLGHTVDKVTELSWHRKWEGWPVRMTILIIAAISVGTLVEALPLFLIKSNIPTISTVKPYTPLELMGRETYIAEGCYNCHSQMIRPMWAETQRYGEYSKPGEFVYDHPFQWGSRRIGPDLHRVGGKYSHDWHVRHMDDPRKMVTGSIMPGYKHLLLKGIPYEKIPSRVQGMALIGVPYEDALLANDGAGAIEHARAQAERINAELIEQGGYPDVADKQVLALVAYLQRLGTDISATPEEEVAE
jgi:cytochrome c oxidase cbb3-type subunit I/II